MLTESQANDLQLLSDLRRRVELLDSHMNVGYINQKQYFESMANITQKVEELENKYGIKPEPLRAFDLMFKDGIEKLDEMMEDIFK